MKLNFTRLGSLWLGLGLLSSGCAPATSTSGDMTPGPVMSSAAPSPDPRIGLRAGLTDAGEAIWNLRLLSKTAPSTKFIGSTNSDIAFTGNYVIQGNYNGFQIWDISNPSQPTLAKDFFCPASQSDVSVYRNLLFVSGEGLSGRLDCAATGVQEAVSHHRLRGIRIFDISDIKDPKYIGNVQTCRGSHTHTVLESPSDRENVYIYISGSAPVRPAEELPGCVRAMPSEDPNSALFRIEVIKVPLANPAAAAIVSSPRIFNDLVEAPSHGLAPEDRAAIERARAAGAFIVTIGKEEYVLPSRMTAPMLDSIAKARGATTVSAEDSAALRAALPAMVARMTGAGNASGPRPGPTQCHDITVYPAIGLAGGACEGYGLLLDISDPVNPRRLDAVADSNFSYWHSATFNNDGNKLLFSDEWGGGGGAKCRATDPKEWGADAIFTIENGRLVFQSYYKLPVAQTSVENCVAHNGSMLPIPNRDIMIQAWYQGGLSMFEFTDPKNPREIGFFDRGPADSTRIGSGGSWSVYWYNGAIVSSEISRGLDILELVPSAFISQNEIDAAKTVRVAQLNTQGQPRFVWPASFALARAYVDQLERGRAVSSSRIGELRRSLRDAEAASGSSRRDALNALAAQLRADAVPVAASPTVQKLAGVASELAAATR